MDEDESVQGDENGDDVDDENDENKRDVDEPASISIPDDDDVQQEPSQVGVKPMLPRQTDHGPRTSNTDSTIPVSLKRPLPATTQIFSPDIKKPRHEPSSQPSSNPSKQPDISFVNSSKTSTSMLDNNAEVGVATSNIPSQPILATKPDAQVVTTAATNAAAASNVLTTHDDDDDDDDDFEMPELNMEPDTEEEEEEEE